MLTHTQVQAWIDAYVDAWRSPGTTKLADIFTEDITYKVSPWKDTLLGLEAVQAFWKQARTGPGEAFTLQNEIVAIEGQTAVVRIEVAYEKGGQKHWRDLWIIRLNAEGQCNAFEEWPFYPGQDDGQKQ